MTDLLYWHDAKGDLSRTFKGQSGSALAHSGQMSFLADYKFPQVLRHHTLPTSHTILTQCVDKQSTFYS